MRRQVKMIKKILRIVIPFSPRYLPTSKVKIMIIWSIEEIARIAYNQMLKVATIARELLRILMPAVPREVDILHNLPSFRINLRALRAKVATTSDRKRKKKPKGIYLTLH